MPNINDNVNLDQQAKSVGGTNNNQVNTSIFETWDNGDDQLFIKKEFAVVQRTPILGNMFERTYPYQMDQTACLVIDSLQTVLVIHVDGTTTFRGERVSTKANEGLIVEIAKRRANKKISKIYNRLSEYKFIHICCIVFPDELADSLRDKNKEDFDIDQFCVGVNYKTRGKYVTDELKNGIDFASRIRELINILNSIKSDPQKYILDKNVLSTAWIMERSDDFKYMPLPLLTEEALIARREHVVHGLKNNLYYYAKKQVDEDVDKLTVFLCQKGLMDPNEKLTMEQRRDMAIAYIYEHYPPQTEISMLSLIERQNDDLRKIGRA